MKFRHFDRTFGLLFTVMLVIAAGNTALQSVLPALGRSLHAPDSAVAAVFSVSALLWVIAAPFWANRSDRHGRRAMVLLGVTGFTVSLGLCGLCLAMGINGLLGPVATFIAFVAGRVIYGTFGSAAPPAVQAIVAGRTSREERTQALTLLASAFGLGTILGPAIAPYLVMGHLWPGGPMIGLAGPAFAASAIGVVIWIAAARGLSKDEGNAHGAASSYPSIGGQGTGATVTAATAEEASENVGYFDPRIRAWIIAGLIVGHAQAMTGQAIGFLVIDRMHLPPIEAIHPTGLVLMIGAGSSLLAQWGLIPMLDLKPRALILGGAALGAIGCVATGTATTLYGIAMGYALLALGMGLARPGFTAGASLAVGAEAQGSVAGKVTSVNGAAFVLGPSLGVGLYELWRPLPYLTAAGWLGCLLVYAWAATRASLPKGGGPMIDDDNETWLLETGHDIIERKAAAGGLMPDTPRERLIYCLWVADYGVRNAGDLVAAADLYPPFREEGLAAARELALPRTTAAFSLPVEDLERDYFELFDGIIDEIKGATAG